MKKLAFILCLIHYVQIQAQTIYTADNNPGALGGANTFTGPTALQDAIDPAINTALVAGDIIHVTRSAIDYGAITLTIPLEIIGIGLDPECPAHHVVFKRLLIDLIKGKGNGRQCCGIRIEKSSLLNGVFYLLPGLLLYHFVLLKLLIL